MKKKNLIAIALVLCIAVTIFTSCGKDEYELINSIETLPTHSIVFPNTSGAEMTFTDVYPSYFQPSDSETIVYRFYLKEGGTITSAKTFGVRHGHIIDNYFEGENSLLFEAEELFTPKTSESYRIYIYWDGSILAEYEGQPTAVLEIFVVSESEYKIMLEDESQYGKNYPINNLTD